MLCKKQLFFGLIFLCTASALAQATDLGKLTVLYGPMWGGKTAALISMIQQDARAGTKILVFKHAFDEKRAHGVIFSKKPGCPTVPAIPVSSLSDMTTRIAATPGVQKIYVDEAMFFGHGLEDFVTHVRSQKIDVVVAGLDLDFKAEGFGDIPALVRTADEPLIFHARCSVCNKWEACYTQRLIGGQPAKYNDPLILVGDKDFYEPRCAHCYVRPVPTK